MTGWTLINHYFYEKTMGFNLVRSGKLTDPLLCLATHHLCRAHSITLLLKSQSSQAPSSSCPCGGLQHTFCPYHPCSYPGSSLKTSMTVACEICARLSLSVQRLWVSRLTLHIAVVWQSEILIRSRDSFALKLELKGSVYWVPFSYVYQALLSNFSVLEASFFFLSGIQLLASNLCMLQGPENQHYLRTAANVK